MAKPLVLTGTDIIVITNAGLAELASTILGGGGPAIGPLLMVDLYQNQYYPSGGSTYSDFTLCNFPGYSTVTIGTDVWGPPTPISIGVQVSYANNPVSWYNSGSTQAIWGFLVRSVATGDVLWACGFLAAVLVNFKQTVQLPLSLQFYNGGPLNL